MSDETMRIVVEQLETGPSSSLADSFRNDATNENKDDKGAISTAVDSALMAANPALGAMKVGLDLAVETFDKLKTSALDFAQRIESVGANIQAANAQRDVRMTQAMVQADQTAGPALGELIKAQAESDAQLMRIDATLNKWGATLTKPFEELRAGVLELLADGLEAVDRVGTDVVQATVDSGLYFADRLSGMSEEQARQRELERERDRLQEEADKYSSDAAASIFGLRAFQDMKPEEGILRPKRDAVPFNVGL